MGAAVAGVGAALTTMRPGDVVGPALYRAADEALHRAKREGRSLVLVDSVEPSWEPTSYPSLEATAPDAADG